MHHMHNIYNKLCDKAFKKAVCPLYTLIKGPLKCSSVKLFMVRLYFEVFLPLFLEVFLLDWVLGFFVAGLLDVDFLFLPAVAFLAFLFLLAELFFAVALLGFLTPLFFRGFLVACLFFGAAVAFADSLNEPEAPVPLAWISFLA